MQERPGNILACIDSPDPDNFALLIALKKLFPRAVIHVLLTGRPVRFNAMREHQLWDYDLQSSQMAHQASAARIKNFLRHFGITVTKVFDGGIAPRTLVPHWVHFSDYYKFFDVDPLAALRCSELEPQEVLIKSILQMDDCSVVVGGPMTGLAQIISRSPNVAEKFSSIHAMFATWGNVQLMQFDAEPRGAVQFNVACDPNAANFILTGLDCPIYLMTTEVTRVSEIGFDNVIQLRESLPDNAGTRNFCNLYLHWYDAAIKPRQIQNPNEKIFIHDLSAAFSLREDIRNSIYEVAPIKILNVPYLPREYRDWGKVIMAPMVGDENVKIFAATNLKPNGTKNYLKNLYEVFLLGNN